MSRKTPSRSTSLGESAASGIVGASIPAQVALGLAPERRRSPRHSLGARGTAGQLFLRAIPSDEVARRTASSHNPLDQHPVAYRLVERIEIDGALLSEESLGEVWLSVRDSTLGGTLDPMRMVHVRVRFDEVANEVVDRLADGLVNFCEARASEFNADSIVLSSAEAGLLQSLSDRGYLDNVVMSTSNGASTFHANHALRSA